MPYLSRKNYARPVNACNKHQRRKDVETRWPQKDLLNGYVGHEHQPIKAPIANQQRGRVHQRFDVGDAKLALPPEPALQQAGQKGVPSPRANQRPPQWQPSQRGGEGRRRAAALNVPDQGW